MNGWMAPPGWTEPLVIAYTSCASGLRVRVSRGSSFSLMFRMCDAASAGDKPVVCPELVGSAQTGPLCRIKRKSLDLTALIFLTQKE